jgi:hypothetical protein
MRGLRISIRGLMGIVLGFAVARHVALSTIRVFEAKEYHSHTWVHVRGDKVFTALAFEQPPFWPRYWRCLLGLPWKSQPLCPEVNGRLLDHCEFAHPEIFESAGGGRGRIVPTQSQIELARRLRNQSP